MWVKRRSPSTASRITCCSTVKRNNAYNAAGFCNETILSEDFPELLEGKTTITWTGGITAVEVTPRWWTL